MALLLACVAESGAAIIYSGAKNLAIPNDFSGIYLNLTTGATANSEFSGWDFNAFFGGLGVADLGEGERAIHALHAKLAVQLFGQRLGLGIEQDIAGKLALRGRCGRGHLDNLRKLGRCDALQGSAREVAASSRSGRGGQIGCPRLDFRRMIGTEPDS